jgi:hypothetical protein
MGQAAISCTDRKPPGSCRGAPSDKYCTVAFSLQSWYILPTMADAPSLTSTTVDTYTPTSATPFGSLTTPFTPPSYCSSVVFECNPSSCGPMEQGRTCGSDGQATVASDCFPRGTERFARYLYSNTALLYVDATACPMDWTSVGTEIDGGGTTRFGCCPPYVLLIEDWFGLLSREIGASEALVSPTAGICTVVATLTPWPKALLGSRARRRVRACRCRLPRETPRTPLPSG